MHGLEPDQDLAAYRRLVEACADIIWCLDANNRYIFVNPAMTAIMGYRPDEVIGRRPQDFQSAEQVRRDQDVVDRILAGSQLSYESIYRHRDGSPVVLRITAVPLQDARGRLREIVGTATDLTELRRSQQALQDERERIQVTLDSIGDGVVTTGLDGRVTYLNPVAQLLCGRSADTAHGLPLSQIFQPMDIGTGRPLPSPVAGVLRDPQTPVALAAAHLRRGEGEAVAIEYQAAPIRDRAGRLSGAVLVFRDVSEACAMAARIAHLATHDMLTGLPNRMLLMDRLGQGLIQTSRHGGRVALMLLDVDRFKQINETLGPGLGDRLLQQVALRLQRCVRRTDTVSRQGGDEFILLLPNAGEPMELSDLAEKIVIRLAEPYQLDGHELHLSVSIGVSMYPDDGSDPEELIKHADIAMYHAKRNGGNGFQFFMDDMNRKATERLFLEHNLRRALERGELVLRYQPQINLRSGRVVGAEALLRWRHPRRGLIPPSRFVPIAEDSGIILPIGRWVLEEACRQAYAWQQQGLPPLRMAVNLSTVELRQKAIVQNVAKALTDSGLPPQWLELELTESVVMSDVPLAGRRLQALKALGLRLSIDDFGTGYSSLSYLKRLPVDSLKIDQAFIRELAANPDDAAIADAIIRMGHSLKLTIIAEGVESRAALNFLRARRCDNGQGYYFSHPVDPERFVELMWRHEQAGSRQGPQS